jgi:hypothetical protein
VLRGDLRDAMLNQLRGATDFSKLDERAQRDINAAIDFAATEFTAKAVQLLASDGKAQVQCKLDKIVVKDGLQIVCSGGFSHDNLVTLGEAQGKQVLITVADAAPYDGQRGEAQVDLDQPDLLPGAEGDDDLVDAADPPDMSGAQLDPASPGRLIMVQAICETITKRLKVLVGR